MPYNFKLYKAVLLNFIVFKKPKKTKTKITKINNPINIINNCIGYMY